jgi:5-methyltetrahydrofolate--homocysteine methyltransferase
LKSKTLKQKVVGDIREELKKRKLILDGAMGTMLQRYQFSEEDFRGER